MHFHQQTGLLLLLLQRRLLSDSTRLDSLFLGGQILLGLALAADVEILAEKNGVHDGLRNEPDNEPHHGLHPVWGDDRLMADPAQRTLGVHVRRGRCEGGPDFRHLGRHVQRDLHRSPANLL